MRRSFPSGIGAAVVTVVSVAVLATTNPARWPGEDRFVAWIGLLLLSFWGWGTLAASAFRADSIRGFVRISLGMAALLAVAGFFLAAHLLTFTVLAALMIVGATAQLWSLFDGAARLTARLRSSPAKAATVWEIGRTSLGHPGYLLAAAVVLGVAWMRLIGSAKVTQLWWGADDTPAYWAFIREMTERGSFDQAFSLRRMVAFGGQTVLQAVTALGVPIRSINVFDVGICPLVLTGVLLQIGCGQWLGIASGLLVAFLPTAALNSGSTFSGSLLFVVVYFALRLAADGSARRGGALVGMTTAAVCTLRHSFIPGCGMLLAAAALAHLASPERRTWRERAAFPVVAAIAFAVTIAPWSLASLISSRTPLFPLFHGTYRGGAVDIGVGGATWLVGLKGIIDEPMKAPQLLVVFAAILALGSRLSRAAIVPLALAALTCTLALAWTTPFNPGDDVRYLAGPWIGLLIAFYCEASVAARTPAPAARDSLLVAGVATILVAMQLAPLLSAGIAAFAENDRTRVSWSAWEGETAHRTAILDLQAHVPPGQALLAACDQQYHFDFRRNKIVLIDLPSVTGPFALPGENATPEQYEEAIAEFVRLGIEYFLFSNPDHSNGLYNAPQWQSFRGDDYRTHDFLVPRFAAWFSFERYVAAHRRIIASAGNEALASLR